MSAPERERLIALIKGLRPGTMYAEAEADALLAAGLHFTGTCEELIYPLVLVDDRYSGAYSKGEWLAFNALPEDIPWQVFGDDISCCDFWSSNEDAVIGKGATPEEAVADLRTKMKRKRDE